MHHDATPPRPGSLRIAARPVVKTLVLFVVFSFVLVTRKPWVLIHPEFWADDGWEWYPDALHLGLACLLQPVNGYLNSFQRLVALATTGLPLLWVARVYAAVGISVQAACGAWLCSARMDRAWPTMAPRLLFATLTTVLPNEAELYGNLTNAQWTLSILAFLVVVSSATGGLPSRIADVAILLVSGLSGPFCLMLLPVAVWVVWDRRAERDERRSASVRLTVLALCSVIQTAFLTARPNHGALPTPLGATVSNYAQIMFRQVLVGVEFGYDNAAKLRFGGFFSHVYVAEIAAAIGIVLIVIALVRAAKLMRQFSLFAGLVALGGLLQPHASTEVPQWVALAWPPCGNRYFSMLSVAWLGALFVLIRQRETSLRAAGALLLLNVLIFGVPRGWRVPNWHTDFAARAAAFETSQPGTVMRFELIPPNDRPMILTRP